MVDSPVFTLAMPEVTTEVTTDTTTTTITNITPIREAEADPAA